MRSLIRMRNTGLGARFTDFGHGRPTLFTYRTSDNDLNGKEDLPGLATRIFDRSGE
jgi:hypothetical protein